MALFLPTFIWIIETFTKKKILNFITHFEKLKIGSLLPNPKWKTGCKSQIQSANQNTHFISSQTPLSNIKFSLS